MLQIRPKDSLTQFYYSPNRDIANITPFYAARAVSRMTEVNREDWFRGYLAAYNVDEAVIAALCDAVAKYVQIVVSDKTVEDSFEALEKAGFFLLPDPAQVIFMAKLGQLFMTGYFIAHREMVHQLADAPFSIAGVEGVAKAAEKAIAKCNRAMRKRRLGFWARVLDCIDDIRNWWAK